MMGDWPTTLLPPLPTITSTSEESLGFPASLPDRGSPTSNVMALNVAYLQPFRMDIGATAVKMCYLVGATPTGNVDMGIYDAEFNLLVSSGAVAQGTLNTLQELDITDTVLHPGNYWMAISASSGSATAFMNNVSDELSLPPVAMYIATSAHVLPSTVSPVKDTAILTKVIAMAVSFDTLI